MGLVFKNTVFITKKDKDEFNDETLPNTNLAYDIQFFHTRIFTPMSENKRNVEQ